MWPGRVVYGKHTLGHGEQQAIIQTIAQYVSHEWQTSASHALAQRRTLFAIVAVCRVRRRHGGLGSVCKTYELTNSMALIPSIWGASSGREPRRQGLLA